jgi:hypothetical protein
LPSAAVVFYIAIHQMGIYYITGLLKNYGNESMKKDGRQKYNFSGTRLFTLINR